MEVYRKYAEGPYYIDSENRLRVNETVYTVGEEKTGLFVEGLEDGKTLLAVLGNSMPTVLSEEGEICLLFQTPTTINPSSPSMLVEVETAEIIDETAEETYGYFVLREPGDGIICVKGGLAMDFTEKYYAEPSVEGVKFYEAESASKFEPSDLAQYVVEAIYEVQT